MASIVMAAATVTVNNICATCTNRATKTKKTAPIDTVETIQDATFVRYTGSGGINMAAAHNAVATIKSALGHTGTSRPGITTKIANIRGASSRRNPSRIASGHAGTSRPGDETAIKTTARNTVVKQIQHSRSAAAGTTCTGSVTRIITNSVTCFRTQTRASSTTTQPRAPDENVDHDIVQ